jgi:hypothetical protein
MAEFLSDAWIEELDGAGVVVKDAPAVTFDQVVTGAPDGVVRYRVSVDGGRLRVRRLADGAADGADATLTTSFGTAVELATGRRDASAALAAGLVRFRGNAASLQAAAGALTALAEGLATVRARTTFPAAPPSPAAPSPPAGPAASSSPAAASDGAV